MTAVCGSVRRRGVLPVCVRGFLARGITQMAFYVDDIDAEVAGLRGRGVVFEEYRIPGLPMVNGIVDIPGNYPSKGRGERGAHGSVTTTIRSGSDSRRPEQTYSGMFFVRARCTDAAPPVRTASPNTSTAGGEPPEGGKTGFPDAHRRPDEQARSANGVGTGRRCSHVVRPPARLKGIRPWRDLYVPRHR